MPTFNLDVGARQALGKYRLLPTPSWLASYSLGVGVLERTTHYYLAPTQAWAGFPMIVPLRPATHLDLAILPIKRIGPVQAARLYSSIPAATHDPIGMISTPLPR
ncbi:hypothetical protein VNO78_02610 [Psophocarpus tetragonolobus]|uniref:Uncharacterized protein n=1 Tax=Psophocarpus tetragonolobus TaxID=3891 RepID=A0AAN9T2Q7_PSOTE